MKNKYLQTTALVAVLALSVQAMAPDDPGGLYPDASSPPVASIAFSANTAAPISSGSVAVYDTILDEAIEVPGPSKSSVVKQG